MSFVEFLLVALLNSIIAVAELSSRYRDEPTRVLLTLPALLYIVVNAFAGLGALYIITVFGWSFGFDANQTAAATTVRVLIAGFGAAALFRSSLFTIRVSDTNVSFGPKVVLSLLLESVDRAIDRIQAFRRLQRNDLDGLSFAKHYVALTQLCTYSLRDPKAEDAERLGNLAGRLLNSDLPDAQKMDIFGLQLLDLVGPTALAAAADRLKERERGNEERHQPPSVSEGEFSGELHSEESQDSASPQELVRVTLSMYRSLDEDDRAIYEDLGVWEHGEVSTRAEIDIPAVDEEFVRGLDIVLRMTASEPRLLLERAWILECAAEFDSARIDLLKAQQMADAHDDRIVLALARIIARQSGFREARSVYEGFIKSSQPTEWNLGALHDMARFGLTRGFLEVEDAKSLLREACELERQLDVLPFAHLLDAFYSLRDEDESGMSDSMGFAIARINARARERTTAPYAGWRPSKFEHPYNSLECPVEWANSVRLIYLLMEGRSKEVQAIQGETLVKLMAGFGGRGVNLKAKLYSMLRPPINARTVLLGEAGAGTAMSYPWVSAQSHQMRPNLGMVAEEGRAS